MQYTEIKIMQIYGPEIALWLDILAGLEKIQVQFLVSPLELTVICNSTSRGSSTLFWSSPAPGTYIQEGNSYTEQKQINLKK